MSALARNTVANVESEEPLPYSVVWEDQSGAGGGGLPPESVVFSSPTTTQHY